MTLALSQQRDAFVHPAWPAFLLLPKDLGQSSVWPAPRWITPPTHTQWLSKGQGGKPCSPGCCQHSAFKFCNFPFPGSLRCKCNVFVRPPARPVSLKVYFALWLLLGKLSPCPRPVFALPSVQIQALPPATRVLVWKDERNKKNFCGAFLPHFLFAFCLFKSAQRWVKTHQSLCKAKWEHVAQSDLQCFSATSR